MINSLKTRHLLQLYVDSTIVIILILGYFNVGSYIYAAWNPAFLPKYVYYFIVILGLPVLLLKQQNIAKATFTPLALWGMVFLILNLVHLITADSKPYFDVAATRMQYVMLAIYFSILIQLAESNRWQKAFPLIAIAIAGVTLLDFFYPELLWPPHSENRIIGRANGFQPNNNAAGEVVLLTALLALPMLKKTMLRTLLVGFSGLAVFVTFSRAAMLMWGILVILGIALRTFPKSALLLLVGAALLLSSASVLLEDYLIPALGYQAGSANLLKRIDSIISKDFSDASANERRQVLQQGLELFLNKPFTGAGSGAAEIQTGIGPHNQLVLMGEEYGIVGIGLWIGLIVLIFRGYYFRQRSLQYIGGTFVIAFTFFTHNLLDYPFWLMTYALLASWLPYWKRSGSFSGPEKK